MGTESRQGPILVATDRSEPAGEAIRQAAARAKVCCARLVVLHVVFNPTPIHPVFPQLSQRDVNEQIRVGRSIAEQLTDEALQKLRRGCSFRLPSSSRSRQKDTDWDFLSYGASWKSSADRCGWTARWASM